MAVPHEALRGYAYQVHRRDNFTCRYCGLDGRASLASWLSLGLEYLLPVGHPERDNPAYQVTACRFCTGIDNRRFDKVGASAAAFAGKTPAELIAQRKQIVRAARDDYAAFWLEHVAQPAPPPPATLTVWFYYSDEASPFLRLELSHVPQVGSPVRIEHGNYIYSGTVVEVQWHFDYAGERMRIGGEVNVHLIVERSAKVV